MYKSNKKYELFLLIGNILKTNFTNLCQTIGQTKEKLLLISEVAKKATVYFCMRELGGAGECLYNKILITSTEEKTRKIIPCLISQTFLKIYFIYSIPKYIRLTAVISFYSHHILQWRKHGVVLVRHNDDDHDVKTCNLFVII